MMLRYAADYCHQYHAADAISFRQLFYHHAAMLIFARHIMLISFLMMITSLFRRRLRQMPTCHFSFAYFRHAIVDATNIELDTPLMPTLLSLHIFIISALS